MTRAIDIANLVDANGDVVAGALDNVPASNDASALTTGTLAAARLPTSGISASAVDTGTLPNGVFPTGAVLQFKQAISQNASTTTITASSNPGQLYGANVANRTFALAQTVTITPSSTSSILYCIGQVGWTSMNSFNTGAHGGIITLNDASSIDNSDYPWYSETQYVAAGNQPYWPSEIVVGTFSPNTTSQRTIRLRPYAYRESGTKTAAYRGTTLIVMEIAG